MEQRILERLQQRGPLHVMELANALDDHPVAVDRSCYRLHQDGYIETHTAGVYELTDAGARHLDGGHDADEAPPGT